MGQRKRIEVNLDNQAKALTEESKVAFYVAEKKFGTLDAKNLEQIKAYVYGFDITKEPYKSDCEKYMDETVKKNELSKKGKINYSDYLVSKYYYDYYNNEKYAYFKNRRVNANRENEKLREKMLSIGLAFYTEDDKFYDMIDEFSLKYGFEIDSDFVINDMLGKERYAKTYRDYFIKIYRESENKEHIDEMFKEYEEIIKRARTFEDIKARDKYDNGSMTKKEVSELLNSLVTYEYDLSRKNKEEISKQCVNSSNKIEVKKVLDFVSEKVNRENNYETLTDATAALKELQILHAERGTLFKFFRKTEYQNEHRRIEELKESIIEQSKSLTNNTFFEDCLTSNDRTSSIYSTRLAEERASIAIYVEKNVKENVEDIISDFEVVENDKPEIANDFEAIMNDEPEIKNDFVKDDDGFAELEQDNNKNDLENATELDDLGGSGEMGLK